MDRHAREGFYLVRLRFASDQRYPAEAVARSEASLVRPTCDQDNACLNNRQARPKIAFSGDDLSLCKCPLNGEGAQPLTLRKTELSKEMDGVVGSRPICRLETRLVQHEGGCQWHRQSEAAGPAVAVDHVDYLVPCWNPL